MIVIVLQSSFYIYPCQVGREKIKNCLIHENNQGIMQFWAKGNVGMLNRLSRRKSDLM